MNFFYTYLGMYIAQSICHSAVAAAIADSSILAWRTKDPLIKQRLRIVVVLVPITSFPIYQALSPNRGSTFFRVQALFDVNRWLGIELWEGVHLGYVFLLFMAAASLVFLLQEMLPILRHTFASRRPSALSAKVRNAPALLDAIGDLPGQRPDIAIIEDEGLVLFSSTGKQPTIYISTGLLDSLSPEEIQGAVAHEVAHIERSRRPILIVVFLMRVLSFFNPVTLVEFRKVVQEEERICDDIAVSMTRRPEALAKAIGRFRTEAPAPGEEMPRRPAGLAATLEQFSHDMLLQGRIFRLRHETAAGTESGRFQLALTLAITLVINYYVV